MEAPLQTLTANSLMWAEKKPSVDCDEAYILPLEERVSFAAYQPVSGNILFSMLPFRVRLRVYMSLFQNAFPMQIFYWVNKRTFGSSQSIYLSLRLSNQPIQLKAVDGRVHLEFVYRCSGVFLPFLPNILFDSCSPIHDW